jgi:hypothetical protein
MFSPQYLVSGCRFAETFFALCCHLACFCICLFHARGVATISVTLDPYIFFKVCQTRVTKTAFKCMQFRLTIAYF